jgi:hypothetical protein
MARQIGLMLNGKEPKVVNGPEILNKYVGQSEENIRNQFKDAEAEYKERGTLVSCAFSQARCGVTMIWSRSRFSPHFRPHTQVTTAICTSSFSTRSTPSAPLGAFTHAEWTWGGLSLK